MNALLFGASGMVGRSVLRECLADDRVCSVTAVGRGPVAPGHPKLSTIVLPDLFRIETVADRQTGFDACFYSVGVTAAGRSEPDYTRLTYNLTLAVADLLVHLNPGMTFIYVSGAGTDATGSGRFVWARVRAAPRTPFARCRSRRPTCSAPA